MADTAKVANFTESQISPLLKSFTQGATEECSCGNDGVTCGMSWGTPQWNSSIGIGEQAYFLEAFNSELVKFEAGLIKIYKDGGTSKANANANAA